MDANRLNNLMKYEFSDENLKFMYTELKEKYFKMFKDYIKFIKNIKNKEEKSLNESVNNLNELTSEIILYKGLLEKIVNLRKNKSDIKDISDLKINFTGPNDELLKNLDIRKNKLVKYKENYYLIKEYTRKTQEFLEEAGLSNCLEN